jgi:IclR family KDG regulon transcriptional repressor
VLAAGDPTLSLGELSSRLGMRKPTVRRVLINLIDRGYVEQDSVSRKYRLGIRCWQVGAAAVAVTDLRTVADGRLESLAKATGEQATLWIYDAGDAICIDRAEGPQRVRSFTRLGTREPVIRLATGRCLLAGQQADEIDRVLTDMDAPQRAGRSVTAWRDHLKQVADRGYDVSSEDRWGGVSAAGAAVHDHAGAVVGAIGISGPTQRVDAIVDDLVHEVCAVAAAMSAHMGYRNNE